VEFIEMQGLIEDPQDAWKLFQLNYRKKYEKEVDDLKNYIPDPSVYRDDCKGMGGKVNIGWNTGKHNLFELLGRHPQAIIYASQFHKDETKMSLKDLYKLILESKNDYRKDQELLNGEVK
jgi:hypothetical protein